MDCGKGITKWLFSLSYLKISIKQKEGKEIEKKYCLDMILYTSESATKNLRNATGKLSSDV